MKAIGAYVLKDANDVVLYVGFSIDVAARIREHRARDWWSDVADVEVHTTTTRDEGLALERELIRTRNPIHNKVRMIGDPVKRPRRRPPEASLKTARKMLGLRAKEIGVRHYKWIESGKRRATAKEFRVIESTIGLPVGSLYYRDEDPAA